MTTSRKGMKARKPALRKQTVKDLDPKDKGRAVKGGGLTGKVEVPTVIQVKKTTVQR